MKIILASQSPRRKEILEKAGYNISIFPSLYDEKINGLQYRDEIVENCAYQKALDVAKRCNSDNIIVAADTVVVLDGEILGKPKDEKDAFDMLKRLSNNVHFVASAICIIKNNNVIKSIDKTYVGFRELFDSDITNYIKTKKPFDKAGSYGIQDDGFDFAINIKGEMDCVVGFPLKLFQSCLLKIS